GGRPDRGRTVPAAALLCQPHRERLRLPPAVFAEKHERATEHQSPLALIGACAEPNLVVLPHLGHIVQMNWRAVDLGQHHGLEIGESADQALTLDELRFAGLLQDTAARVAVAIPHYPRHIVQSQVVFDETLGVDDDVILFFLTAPGVDLRDARYLEHLRA